MNQENQILGLCEGCINSLKKVLDSNISAALSLALNQKLLIFETAVAKFKDNYIDFEEICNHLIDAIYVADKNGKTIYVNQAYLDFSGLTINDFVGKSVYEINSEKKLYTNGVIPTVIKTKERTEAVGTVISTNKKIFITGIPILDENGELKYAVAHDKDIDHLERLKDALALLKSQQVSNNAELEYLRQRQLVNKEIIAKSKNMSDAVQTAHTVAATDVTVLIWGESGTGKEVIADYIYKFGKRTGKPFIKINCSAIPSHLLESELFGYEEGSFTGAIKGGKAGLFEIASGGVILLDEIGDMPIDLQTKLLRVLQEKEVCRIGGSKVINLDVRIIASTNKDLLQAIKKGEFREDLYYRLNVVPIYLAPLRERREDIQPLVKRFLDKYNKRYAKLVQLTPGALSILTDYQWPGNIRELKNVMERMIVINSGSEIDAATVKQVLGILPVTEFTAEPQSLHSTQFQHTSENIAENTSKNITQNTSENTVQNNADHITSENGDFIAGSIYLSKADNSLKKAVEEFEKDIIRSAISENGSKRKAATALKVDHS
ncbi:MAG: sigma-54 interaction domain-containing protein, partial [Aminipila sp.]